MTNDSVADARRALRRICDKFDVEPEDWKPIEALLSHVERPVDAEVALADEVERLREALMSAGELLGRRETELEAQVAALSAEPTTDSSSAPPHTHPQPPPA